MITEFDHKSECVNFINCMVIRTADISIFLFAAIIKQFILKWFPAATNFFFFITGVHTFCSFGVHTCHLIMTGGLARCFKSFFALCMWHRIQCHDLQSWPCSTDRTNQIKGGCIHVGKERKQPGNILSVMLDWFMIFRSRTIDMLSWKMK